MRVLVADDDPSTRFLIQRILEREGYEVVTATDGIDALAKFSEASPDILLTDYSMPEMNGVELCRVISAAPPGRFVPIIMLTGGDDPGLLVRSLEAGALEFLSKPIKPDELRSRVRAIAELARSHNALAEAQAAVEHELGIVKHLLERVTLPGLQTLPPHFAMETIQTQRINGDACAFHETLAGVHFGLLCDATGHGLAAGVSTLPVVEAFNAMAAKDSPLETIYLEVNRKLMRLLPTGRFACLLLLRLDSRAGTLQVLNAGMPDVLHLDAEGGDLRRFQSLNLPAGVVLEPPPPRLDECSVQAGDRIFACSDGLLELFSEEEATASFLRRGSRHPVAEDHQLLRRVINNTLLNAEQHDDVTWALWQIPPAKHLASLPAVAGGPGGAEVPGLALQFTVDPRHPGLRELVPNILGLLGYQGVAPSTLQLLGLLLTEALFNAVDHGLLGLDSALKNQGFEPYEQARRSALSEFRSGEVCCDLQLWFSSQELDRLSKIRVEVTDTGGGFDWRPWLQAQGAGLQLPHGRGIQLLGALSTGLQFSPKGNSLSFWIPC